MAEVQECKKADISPKALEEWLEAAEVEVLPDYILEPDVDKSLFEAITCREGFHRDIYAPYFIRLWLGIDENDRNRDDLEVNNFVYLKFISTFYTHRLLIKILLKFSIY